MSSVGLPPQRVLSYACNFKQFIREVISGYTSGEVESRQGGEQAKGGCINEQVTTGVTGIQAYWELVGTCM